MNHVFRYFSPHEPTGSIPPLQTPYRSSYSRGQCNFTLIKSLGLSVYVLQKNKSIRTVVNKVDSIDNEFRVFKMEVLAGEPDFIVEAVCLRSSHFRRVAI